MAEVSGPGKFSERTDKAVSNANSSLPNAGYGEQQDYQELKSAAPMADAPSGVSFSDLFGNPADSVIGLGEDSLMPDTPVTDGADAGPGAGSEVLTSTKNTSAAYVAAYLPVLQFIASREGSSDAARNLVRILKSQV